MIDFKFSVNVDGAEKALHALADSLEDVTTPLLRTGGQIRARAKKTFASEGDGKWPALAESTQKRKLTNAQVALLENRGRGKTGQRSIVERIVRDAAGAEKWSAKAAALNAAIETARAAGRKTAGIETRRDKALAQARLRVTKIMDKRHIARAAGIDPRELVAFARREVARSKHHGAILRSFRKLKAAGYTFTDAERRAMLRQGARRYKASAESTKMLGGLADTLGMKVADGRLAVYSKAFISGIHNDGGTAGHGAKIPKREFLTLEDADLDLFVDVLREQAIDAWVEA